MTDKPRAWPNIAKEARDRAAEEAARGIRQLLPVVMGERDFTDFERLRREAIALNAFQTIIRLLESMGAQTRP